MLQWVGGARLLIAATVDATVQVWPGAYLRGLDAASACVRGEMGAPPRRPTGARGPLVLTLLRGELVTVERCGAADSQRITAPALA